MAKSHSKPNHNSKNSAVRWTITVFVVTLVISATISLVSEGIMQQSNVFSAFIILLVIVFLGIVFDIVGVAVTSASTAPFHSMASRKVAGAQECIFLLNHAERVSSFCNDVVGDICGVVSGSASAAIAMRVVSGFSFSFPQIVTLVMSALVAGLTVGGKSVGKSIAINRCTEIVFRVGLWIYYFRKIPLFFKNKKSKR